MAHHKSAKKRIRSNARRAEVNTSRVGRIRTFLKRVEAAIGGGNKEAAQAEFKLAQPELQRGTTRGVIHRNTVSRKLSRLTARIKAMA
jgi:small subunit ribosomal protein S20